MVNNYKSKRIKNKNKTKNKTVKNKSATTNELVKIRKKYMVAAYGNKKQMANIIFTVRRSALSTSDLKLLLPLLDKENTANALEYINKREFDPVTDYKGLWKSDHKQISKMTRSEIIKELQDYRDAWEAVTHRNQDMSDERLNSESISGLKTLLKFYYSDDAKNIAIDWLKPN